MRPQCVIRSMLLGPFYSIPISLGRFRSGEEEGEEKTRYHRRGIDDIRTLWRKGIKENHCYKDLRIGDCCSRVTKGNGTPNRKQKMLCFCLTITTLLLLRAELFFFFFFFFLLEFVTLRCVQCFPSFFFFYPPRGGRHLFLPSDRVDRRSNSSSRQTPTAGCVLFLFSHFLWLVWYLLSVGWSGLSLSLSLAFCWVRLSRPENYYLMYKI